MNVTGFGTVEKEVTGEEAVVLDAAGAFYLFGVYLYIITSLKNKEVNPTILVLFGVAAGSFFNKIGDEIAPFAPDL
ncbi:hypothetical protein NDU88_006205 [Pleurodeles waltl]|uniref:Uncharacterized protein n=1 Tax=Pleurodeles waltl TaxID=8319 RepID=A0AAV7MGV4_PLEWA|nr:hypothetical protein NDU88_006205 [Pleurodeles waltl]